MLNITLDPNIFTKSPWNKIPENQRRTFEYVIENAASIATQAHLFPKQDSGMINGAQYVQGQSTTRALAIGLNGAFLDEATLKNVFSNKDNGGGGSMQSALAYGIQRGILVVKTAAGTTLTADDIWAETF